MKSVYNQIVTELDETLPTLLLIKSGLTVG